LCTIGSQVAWQQLMLYISYFSLTVASCFKLVDEEYIEELKDKNENENTKNSMEYLKNIF